MKNYTFLSVLKVEMSDFVQLRLSQGLRDHTRVHILKALDEYLTERAVSEKALTPLIVDGWLAMYSRKLNVNTINNFVNYYAPFARYLNVLGIPAFIPERPIYQHTYVPYIFTEQEIKEIFRGADEMAGRINGTMSRLQFPMLLRLLYGCGLRLGEALRLRLDDFDTANGVLNIFNAKGNTDRLVPMENGLSKMLVKYCDALFKGNSGNPFLFEREDRNARSPEWAKWYWPKVLAETRIEIPKLPPHSRNICLHCFRHTFAVSSLRMNETEDIDGYDVTPLLSVYLGHKHLTGTQVYLHMTAENAEDIFKITNAYAKEIFPGVPQL
jgi:integrase/recombinase XerD